MDEHKDWKIKELEAAVDFMNKALSSLELDYIEHHIAVSINCIEHVLVALKKEV